MTDSPYGPRGAYKVRESPPGCFAFLVPRDIAERVGDRRFDVVLTEDGILYRPTEYRPVDHLPEWIRND